MRLDYELFNQQLGILGEEESEVFRQFIRGEKDLQTNLIIGVSIWNLSQ